MVIDTNNGINPGHSPRGRTTGAGNTTSGAQNQQPARTEPTGGRDNDVSLSPEAQSMSRLQSRVDSLPEVDSEKVESIKQAITEGRFEFDVERIAENMLNQDELLS